jgi:hypothetical protein
LPFHVFGPSVQSEAHTSFCWPGAQLATVQEQNVQLAAALKKAAREAKDLGDAKSDLEIELSKHQLQLSTAQSDVRATGQCFLPMPMCLLWCECVDLVTAFS